MLFTFKKFTSAARPVHGAFACVYLLCEPRVFLKSSYRLIQFFVAVYLVVISSSVLPQTPEHKNEVARLTNNEQELSQPVFLTTLAPNTAKELRIITLAPHLAELVAALGLSSQIIAVSEHTDFPVKLQKLPTIASYQGANIAQIIRLNPTHILSWKGGNRAADIAKLNSLAAQHYSSKIETTEELLLEIINIGRFLGAKEEAEELSKQLSNKIKTLKSNHGKKKRTLVYYLSQTPFIGLGNDVWINELLSLCAVTNIYSDSKAPFPQLNIANIIRAKPSIIIAATHDSVEKIESFWAPHLSKMNTELVKANPDELHRFTPRAINAVEALCEKLNASED